MIRGKMSSNSTDSFTVNAIPELDARDLRKFGLVTGGIIAGLFGFLFPWLLDTSWVYWPWTVAGILVLWGLAAPKTLGPIYRLWMQAGLLLSRVTTPVVLAMVFYLVIVPVAVVMRAARHDPMARRFEKRVDTYRVWSRKPAKENMERPF